MRRWTREKRARWRKGVSGGKNNMWRKSMVTVDNFTYLRLEWICKYVLENDFACFLVRFVHSVLDTYTIPIPRQCGCRDGVNGCSCIDRHIRFHSHVPSPYLWKQNIRRTTYKDAVVICFFLRLLGTSSACFLVGS